MESTGTTTINTTKRFIFAPLSILSGVSAIFCIPTIYGAFVCAAIGTICGLAAIREKHKMLGTLGIIFNLIVVIVAIVLLSALSSYRPE